MSEFIGAPDRKRPAYRVNKRILFRAMAIFLPLAALVTGFLGTWYYLDNGTQQAVMRSRQWQKIWMAKRQITQDFTLIVSDILYLAKQYARYDAMGVEGRRLNSLLTADYQAMAESKRIYDQIRLLDATGMEKIRVDFVGGGVRATPPSGLQFKGSRYYFVNSLALGEGEVYMSRLDLNMEHGRVEQPFKPMIRILTPVMDRSGTKSGILILNYLARTMLISLKADTGVIRGNLMVVEPEGYWLLGKSPDDEWGFMLEKRKERRFGRDFPDAWASISRRRQGTATEKDHLFTYDTVYPLKEVQALCRQRGTVLDSGYGALDTGAYYWKIISELPMADIRPDPKIHAVFGAAACVLLLMLSVRVSHIIDERQRAEVRLKKSREGLARAQEIAKLGNWEWDAVDDRFFWSEQSYRTFGAEPGTLAGDYKTFLGLIHPDDRQTVIQHIDSALNTATPYTIEHRIVRIDGQTRTVTNQGEPKTDVTGKVRGLFGVLQDITEQKQLENTIRENQERLQAMSQASLDALILCDSRGRTLFWNTAAAEMFGYSQEEVLGKDIHRLIAPPEDYEAAAVGMRRFADTGQGPLIDSVVEFEAVRKGGERFPVGRAVAAFEHDGQWFAVAGIRDITKRKKAEKALTDANAKLLELGKLKDKFLGMAAHDMRNPLVSIRGFSEMLAEGALGPVDDQQKEFLGIIQKTAQDMLALINDLLDISVIESGKLELNREPADMTALVEERLHLIRAQAEKKQIDIQTRFDPVDPFPMDARRMAQVIDNLVSNAVKYSPAGSTVTIGLTADETSVTFSVKDEGPGIPASELPKLFGEFQRLSTKPTAGESSTGLGLSIAKKIATAHDGDIAVASTEGVGSVFTLILPRGEKP